MTRRLSRDDGGAATMIGAILVLAVLGMSIVYVNAYHVPRQGAAREVAAREEAEASLVALASALQGADVAPLVDDLPLQGPRPSPPLLSGVVLSPAIAQGRLQFEPGWTNVSVSSVIDAPAGGVPAGDPMRVDVGGGRMRVYALGSASGGAPLGTILLTSGGAYLETATYQLAGGAVIVDRADGSALVSPPGLQVGAASSETTVAWRVPVLAGAAAETAGAGVAQLSLAPGPLARFGGGQLVHSVEVKVQTNALAAWKTALEQVVGARGTVSVVESAPDAGTVTATILPPTGTPSGTPAVRLTLEGVRYELDIGSRTAG